MFAFQACLRRGAVPALFYVTLLVLPMLIMADTVTAAAPKLINYQGRLTTSAGAPVTDGVYTVRFRIYSDSTGGTSLWEETQPVSTKSGLFSVILGETITLPDTAFASPNRFLSLKVNFDAEISPRTRLVSSPYAISAAGWVSSAKKTYTFDSAGVGTNSPFRKLEVRDSTSMIAARFGTTSPFVSAIEVYNTSVSNGWELGTIGSSGVIGLVPKSFYMGRQGLSAIPFVVDSSGRVGIGGESGGPYTLAAAALYVRGTLATGGQSCHGMVTYGAGDEGDGIHAYGSSFEAWAGYFGGDVQVSGTLYKSAGSFKIDHPLDPENKYLSHSFVESPDMMNIYNGNVVLDASGEAIVTMPKWFDALNRDFRYQLTAIGAPGPNLYIAQKITGNQFKIAGGSAGMEVSWMVTGIRQDPYANAHRIPVEEDKPEEERGYYQHPELYGQPLEQAVEWARNPELMQQIKTRQETGRAK